MGTVRGSGFRDTWGLLGELGWGPKGMFSCNSQCTLSLNVS